MEIDKKAISHSIKSWVRSLEIDGRVYAFSIAVVEGVADSSVLSKEELQTFEELGELRKASYCLGRVAAKSAVSALVPSLGFDRIEILSGIFGQPVLRCDSLRGFNVSIAHTGEVALAIVFPEEVPCGVDVEKLREGVSEMIAPELSYGERKLLAGSGKDAEAVRIWGAKEAMSKVLRTGMAVPARFFEINESEKRGGGKVYRYQHFDEYLAVTYTTSEVVFVFAVPIVIVKVIEGFYY
ncbi:hypothetical protein FUAX_42230 (plasmid) [Fulvitalea axinellae]|uniref:4'-phosphopantetheinyl transferase domain-containing protein n=1 Tax=Fulvitalea axinellae TaxID=1182444 RepID=A0AAU9CRL5_9BACT|nr:hypothetical protein FUAX_42230 [Fulvitalea axinellae]